MRKGKSYARGPYTGSLSTLNDEVEKLSKDQPYVSEQPTGLITDLNYGV